MLDRTPLHSRQPAFDDATLEDLLSAAHEVDRFEAVALGRDASDIQHPTPAASGPFPLAAGLAARRRSVGTGWKLPASLAAAAALSVSAFMALRTPSNPALGPTTLTDASADASHTSGSTRSSQGAIAGGERAESAAPRITLASAPAPQDWLAFEHLDPELQEGGLPTLSGQRSLIIAVSQGHEGACECLSWSVEDPEAIEQSKPALLARALANPCAAGADKVVLVAVTGPRSALPFHDQDAREWAQCFVSPPVAPEQACEDPGDDVCRSALASLCLPEGLTVSARTVTLGMLR